VSQLQNEIDHIVRRSFMFHYRVFNCLEAVFAAGGRYNLLQGVSDAR
jgi:hypothetical protein